MLRNYNERIQCCGCVGDLCATDQKLNLMYLRHQWSDGADTLQFCSTDEYFETVEYEPQRPLGYRDSLWFVSDLELQATPDIGSWSEFFSDFARVSNFRWIVLHHNLSESLQSFFTYRFHVYTLWENWQEVDLRRLESRKLKNWKKIWIFAEMGGRPTWRAWPVKTSKNDLKTIKNH